MVVGIVALVVFAIMGLFSAKYRGYAKESSKCVFRMVTLRPCDTQFDEKMKSKITGKLIRRSPRTAGFVYKNFKLLSWIFVVIFLVSVVYSGFAVYNLAVHGTCDPVTGECVFNPDVPACELGTCEQGCTCQNEVCDETNPNCLCEQGT